MTNVRPYDDKDWDSLWPIIRDIVRAGDTFTYDPALSEARAKAMWTDVGSAGRVTVVETDGRVVGTAEMGPNREGPGRHVATASFMVGSDSRGRGAGALLVRDAIEWARSRGFAGMQFNAVAESNSRAVNLYEREGFSIVGTVPGAFDHPTLGRVGLLVMYQEFASLDDPG